MSAGTTHINPIKLQGKDKRSAAIISLREQIEARTRQSIEAHKKERDEFSLFRMCLIYVPATYKAMCAALDIPAANGRQHVKRLKEYKQLFEVRLAHCPVTGGKDWIITTNPRKARPNPPTIAPTKSPF